MSATATLQPVRRLPYERINWFKSIPFLAIAIPFAAIVYFWTGIGWSDPLIIFVRCFVAMFFVTGVRHRFFSHATYEMKRWLKFVAAFFAETDLQKGIGWWASGHRGHHKKPDTVIDPHTPAKGFWWAHMGWIMSDAHRKLHPLLIRDIMKYPELKWLDRLYLVPPALLAAAFYWLHGGRGLVDFAISTCIVYHLTFLINSVTHLPSVGTRRFDVGERIGTSRNSRILAWVTLGEGWHNNHHNNPGMTQQGMTPDEVDITYWILKQLERLKIVSGVKGYDSIKAEAA